MMRFPVNKQNVLWVFLWCFVIHATGADTALAAAAVDSGSLSWRPNTESIKVTAVSSGTAAGVSLHIAGTINRGEDYAVSDFLFMSGYVKYRVTASLLVKDLVSLNSSPVSKGPVLHPYLRVECLLNTADGPLGRFSIDSAQEFRLNERIKLSGEFRAPWGTKFCRLVAASRDDETVISARTVEQEKKVSLTPSREGRKIDAFLDDVKIEPIEEFTLDGKYILDPFPSSLEKVRGVHPRLYVRKEGLPDLVQKSGTTHAHIWNEIKGQADKYLKSNPPEYRGNTRGTYDEQWWMSRNADVMVTMAMAYMVTGEKRYLEGARKWALVTCRYPTWGVGWADGIDCMTGHNLYGLAIVYDWLHDSLDGEALGTIRETLITHGRRLFEAAGKGVITPNSLDYSIRPWPEWEEAWLQNHLWINSCGLGTAGLALFDEVEDAGRWAAFAVEKYQHTLKLLGPDGASHEGVNYWNYGIEHLLMFMYLGRDLLDIDMYGNEWFRNTAAYRLYMSLPQNAWARENFTMNYADSYPRDYKGPDYILRALAAEYRDGHAQWLADALDKSGVQNPGNDWLNMIWYNPSIPAVSPGDMPTLKHFTDMDFVSARSGWDGGESFLFFTCGPYIGRTAMHEMAYCASSAHHVHPDKNGFTIHGSGEWLIRDDGTGNCGKYTIHHNTLMIDGREQLGGGGSIFDGTLLLARGAMPEIVSAESKPEFDHIIGDATTVYAGDQGLRRFVRHLIFIKPDVLIVVDDIALDHARVLDLRFHPERQEAAHIGNAFVTRGEKAVLRIEPLTPENVDITLETHPLINRDYGVSPMLAVRLSTKKSEWRNATAFSWSPKEREPVKVALKKEGDLWRFSAGGRTVILRWKNMKEEGVK